MKEEEEEWSYQHPDKLPALSIIPLADAMSHNLRIPVINININSVSHDHVPCRCFHSSAHLWHKMASSFWGLRMNPGWSFMLSHV